MKIPIGWYKGTTDIRLIGDVKRGSKCDCVCPGCLSPLVAKKGDVNAHHFAHTSPSVTQSCRETALHLLAKHWLQTNQRVWLPPHTVCSDGVSILNEPYCKVRHSFCNPVGLKSIELESYLQELKIQPDVLCTIDIFGTEYPLAVEIAVTHKVDKDKYAKVNGGILNMVEINLEHLLEEPTWTMESVGSAICGIPNIKWINVSPKLHESLYTRSIDMGALSWEERNKEIALWHSAVVDHFKRKPAITLPQFNHLKATLINTVTDMEDNEHTVNLSEPPIIGGVFTINKMGPISCHGVTLSLEWQGKAFTIDVGLRKSQNSPYYANGASALRLTGELPLPHRFEKSLIWVRSNKADRFEEKCEAERQLVKSNADRYIQSDILSKWETVNHYLKLEREKQSIPPTAANLTHLIERSIECKADLISNNYNLDDISWRVPGYWIFGCHYAVWQLPLFIELTTKPQGFITAPLVDKLLKGLGFKAMYEIQYLSVKKQTLEKISTLRATQLPVVYKVINGYLNWLAAGGYLDQVDGQRFNTYTLAKS